jgi:hypothetical protein
VPANAKFSAVHISCYKSCALRVLEPGTGLNWPVHEDEKNKSWNVKWNISLNRESKSKKGSNKTADRITDLYHETKSLFRNWQANQKYYRAFYRPKFRSHAPNSPPLQLPRYRQIVQGRSDRFIGWDVLSWYELMWRANRKEPPFLITTWHKTEDHGACAPVCSVLLTLWVRQGLVPDQLPTQISCVTCQPSR